MIDIKTTDLTDRTVIAACLGGSRLRATGLSLADFGAGVVVAGFSGLPSDSFVGRDHSVSDERLTKAHAAVKATTGVLAYAGQLAAVGAGEGCGVEFVAASREDNATQKHRSIQHHTVWAFRGPKPWRDPA